MLVLLYRLLYKGNNVVFVSQVLCTGNVLFAGQALGLIVAGKSVGFLTHFGSFQRKWYKLDTKPWVKQDRSKRPFWSEKEYGLITWYLTDPCSCWSQVNSMKWVPGNWEHLTECGRCSAQREGFTFLLRSEFRVGKIADFGLKRGRG